MLNQENLKINLNYDKNTGLFIRLVSNNHIKIGTIAGYKNKLGYISISILGNSYLAHRLAFLYEYGKWPDKDIDHINCIRHDNRIVNLRIATKSENSQNKISAHCNNKSGVLGVSLDKRTGKWRADIRINGKGFYLGSFINIKDAENKYLESKKILHSSFNKSSPLL